MSISEAGAAWVEKHLQEYSEGASEVIANLISQGPTHLINFLARTEISKESLANMGSFIDAIYHLAPGTFASEYQKLYTKYEERGINNFYNLTCVANDDSIVSKERYRVYLDFIRERGFQHPDLEATSHEQN